MPRIAGVRARELRNLLLRLGFAETRHNDHWRFRHFGLRLGTKISFGRGEISATQMGRIVTHQLMMTEEEFRSALDGNVPERFTNPEYWNG